MQCEDSDSEYELANEVLTDSDRIDKVISETLGQQPSSSSNQPDVSSTQEKEQETVIEELKEKEKELPEYTESELTEIKQKVLQLKDEGNTLYKSGEYYAAMEQYTEGISLCRKQLDAERSILHANRAACHIAKSEFAEGEEDCTEAITLNEHYVRAILRRAQVREKLDKLSGALEDYTSVLKHDPRNGAALEASRRLPEQIKIQQEKMKEECMAKLKDLGNLCLRPFGLSTDNFNMIQDPNTGGYNIQFSQNK